MSTFTNIDIATEVMVGLGNHMKVDLSLNQALQVAMATETDAHRSSSGVANVIPLDNSPSGSSVCDRESSDSHSNILHDALSDLRNWKLHDRFFVQFPEFKASYQQAHETLPVS